MAVGFSDGTSYEDMHDYYLGQPHSKEQAPDRTVAENTITPPKDSRFASPPPDPKDQSRVPQGSAVGATEKPTGELFNTQAPQLPAPGFNQPIRPVDRLSMPIDRDHHVPLVASALVHPETGQMYGMAIDHRLDISDDDAQLLALHEGSELPHMQNLMLGGMSPQDAYHEAHDKIATPTETAASIAKWGTDGHEAYQGRMRDAAAIASEPTAQGRHNDAHTTIYGLDESELGKDHMDEMHAYRALYTHLAEGGDPHNPIQMDVLGQGMAQGAKAGPNITKDIVSNSYGDMHVYRATDSEGNKLGQVEFNIDGRHAYLAGTRGPKGPNSLGPSIVRKVFQKFIEDNPDINTVSATRVTGARNAAGSTSSITFNVVNGRLKLQENSKNTPEDIADNTQRLQRENAQEVEDYTARLRRLNRRQPPSEEPATTPDKTAYTVDSSERGYVPDWMDQPLRNRQGHFMNRNDPLADVGPAMFRNALRSLDVPTNTLRDQPAVPPMRDRGRITDEEAHMWQQRGDAH